MKTVNDLISELEDLSDDLKELPVAVIAENGLLLTPIMKFEYKEYESPLIGGEPTRAVITWQG